jgi:hypothetical protein
MLPTAAQSWGADLCVPDNDQTAGGTRGRGHLN